MIKHKKCGKSHFGVIRSTKLVEYRVLNDVVGVGKFSYKGNWKQEQKQTSGTLKLKCLACETEIGSGGELTGCGEFKIDKSKGVLFITDAWEKFM